MENSKRMSFFGIRGKLVSAVCMLLVAVIMVVSSTYAWFTLSTAPEVSGISTSIGSNGSLEIKLNRLVDGNAYESDTNATYGNFVNLADYGLDKVTLLPSALQIGADGKLNIKNFVSIPTYDTGGRADKELLTNKTVFGTYTDGAFYDAENDLGVRAVGSASGLSDRQLAFRNARYAVSTYSSLAKNTVASSLATNGNGLANIIMTKAAGSEIAAYTNTDVATLKALVTDLNVAIGQLETAYQKYIIAYAASKAVETGDTADYKEYIYKVVESNFEDGSLTLDSIVENKTISVRGKGDNDADYTVTITIGEEMDLYKALAALKTTKANVADAQTKIDDLPSESDEYSWDQISPILNTLVDYQKVTVNGQGASYIKDNLSTFANAVIKEGCKIQMAKDSGVFSDIAEHCGDYSVNVTVDVQYGSLTLEDFPASMTTEAPNQTRENYVSTVVSGLTEQDPSDDESGAMPMTEFYGYIIDLTFRTNASNSNLLLQADAKDRIYDDNDNPDTQGGGSYMTFKATSSDFTNDQIKNLMSKINIVFFNPADGTIYAYAMLDVDHINYDADGATAKMYIYEVVDAIQVGNDDDAKYYYYTETTTTTGEGDEAVTTTTRTYYTDAAKTEKVTDEDTETTIAAKGKAVEVRVLQENASITALEQNVAVNVSTFVYLDGTSIENSDVSAASSVSVKMNLQFSSDATLTPMEYANLHQKAQQTTTNTESETQEPGN